MGERSLDLKSVAVGAGLFVVGSWVAHCIFGLGPWGCQKSDPRRTDCVPPANEEESDA